MEKAQTRQKQKTLAISQLPKSARCTLWKNTVGGMENIKTMYHEVCPHAELAMV